MKKILITGQNSYIGNAVYEYLKTFVEAEAVALGTVVEAESGGPETSVGEDGGKYQVHKISLRDEAWKNADFSAYDTILHVAGKAHVDVAGVSEAVKQQYYEVNGKLPALVAEKAKAEGVTQFIYLSSVIIYGDSADVGKEKHITADTTPAPTSFYGDSKLQGENGVKSLNDAGFRVAIVRLPMVYGKGSKGNYPLLEKIAGKTPVFPNISNQRSMLYIENLTEFIRLLIESGEGGIFFPQNREYVTTAEMVQLIGAANRKKIYLWKVLNPFVWLASKVPGKIGALANKAFGSLTVDEDLSNMTFDYQKYSLQESIGRIHEN